MLGSLRSMSAAEVTKMPPRDRCRGCGQRFEGDDTRPDLLRPWVSFGEDHEGHEVETDERGRPWLHSRLLVCGGCLRKAADLIEGHDQRLVDLETELRRAEAAKADAVETARALTAVVAERLDGFAPPAPVDLDGMKAKDLREYAKEQNITIGPGNHSADKLREMIRDTIGSSS